MNDVGTADIGLPDKVAFLRRPQSYPEGTRHVATKESHFSWVFLTDRHAYKLKKPVSQPYLDFSTLELRRVDCAREVELNRRLAPGVYEGVVALNLGPDGALSLGAPERPVEYLVKMKRLAEERTLEYRIGKERLAEADVRTAARRLARFYDEAESVPMDREAYLGRLAAGVDDMLDELLKPDFDLPHDVARDVAGAQRDFLAREADLVGARGARVVEAHGDLRPEHIYLGPRPVVLDCLEFNRDLRLLDPVDELAFLTMECRRLGAPEAGEIFLDVYREASGDDAPGRLVAFYASHRAGVRAVLAVWHLKEPDLANPAKWTARAVHYLRLARDYANRFA